MLVALVTRPYGYDVDLGLMLWLGSILGTTEASLSSSNSA